jgi:glycosyltransferase involved in cell wall biosynthesis
MDERLKILYISHYYPPEVNAPAVRVSEMANRWSEQGADVTVLTCFPNHPAGVIPEEYRGIWRCREKHEKIDVIRTYVYAAPNKGFLKRIINFLSFMLSAIFIGTPMVGKPDILIATSPQFFVAVAGYIISRIKRCKFVFEVRDIWPEEIVAVGALKNKFAIKLLEKLEMFLYRKADLIVAVAHGTIDVLKKRGIPESKMAIVPNGVDLDHFDTADEGYNVRRELCIDDKFIVGYIGTHGMAHKLETVIEAASLLRDDPHIQFLFVGDGAEKDRLVTLASVLGLKNIMFHKQIGRERIPQYYAACDICLVPLRKADLFTKNIPSKIYEIMAAKRPILISTDGESRRLVERSGAGLAARPEDSENMAEKIQYLRDNKGFCDRMGRSGYSFVLANSSRRLIADNYLAILKNTASNKPTAQELKQIEINAENINSAKENTRVFV